MNFEDYETLPTTNVTSHMMAGAFAGIMEHCVMYPMDSVKTRMQSLTPSPNQTIGSVFSRMVEKEGILRPVRGMQIAIISAGPAHSLYFSCYEFLKEVLTTRFSLNSHLAHGTAGCIATFLHDGIMTPADVVKQRMQMYGSPYRGVVDCIRKTYRLEGPSAFYRSYTTQLTMNLPFQSLHFVVYEIAQTFTNPTREYNPSAHMVSGALAGGIAAAITTPLDVCKTLLNTQSEGKMEVRGLMNAVRTVHRLGGFLGFFKGMSARVIYQMPSTAICWSTYEFFKFFFISRREEHDEKKRYPRDSAMEVVQVKELYHFFTKCWRNAKRKSDISEMLGLVVFTVCLVFRSRLLPRTLTCWRSAEVNMATLPTITQALQYSESHVVESSCR